MRQQAPQFLHRKPTESGKTTLLKFKVKRDWKNALFRLCDETQATFGELCECLNNFGYCIFLRAEK